MNATNRSKKARIAHLSGPTATIQNTPPLVTSNKARAKHGLRLAQPMSMAHAGGFDALRPQRLAAPAKIYVEQFSAHPLEADAAELYGPPDGYIGADGAFQKDRPATDDKAVYEIELRPEDGLYPLPYMAVQADGEAWEEECADPGRRIQGRQGFFPDGSRSFEEIDRLSIGAERRGERDLVAWPTSTSIVARRRRLHQGPAAEQRTDMGEGDIPPETRGKDFFPYKPYHLARRRRGRRSRSHQRHAGARRAASTMASSGRRAARRSRRPPTGSTC